MDKQHTNLILDDILQYIPRFANEIFVLFFSGTILSQGDLNQFSRQIAILHSVGIQLIVVLGARPQINAMAEQENVSFITEGNLRVTSKEMLNIVKQVSLDLVEKFMSALSNVSVTGFTIRPVWGNFVKAKSLGIIKGIDFLFTGQVDKIRKKRLSALLNQGFLPMISAFGMDDFGNSYNLRAVEVAAQVAVTMQAKKLIYIIDEDYAWICDRTGVMELDELEKRLLELKKMDALSPQVEERLRTTTWACHKGVERLHFIDGNQPNALLREIFTKQGIGLMITGERYANIRQAGEEDINYLLEIMDKSSPLGELRQRQAIELKKTIQDFFVFELDGKICGAVALHTLSEAHSAELAGLVVQPDYRQMGLGKKLVAYTLNVAAKKGIKNVYALTTRAEQFFLERGFHEIKNDLLPEVIMDKWQTGRNSRVFIYKL